MVKLRFAMVCASNMNRSMAAHEMLQTNGLSVGSFGVAERVKLPGPSQREANVYTFGTPYEQIHAELSKKDPELYARNGVLQMLARNMGVKTAPERFQDDRSGPFDVVLTFEERIMDQVVEDLSGRDQELMRAVLVINMDVKDSHSEAALAAQCALTLSNMLEAAEDWEDEIDTVVEKFTGATGRRAIYTICFY